MTSPQYCAIETKLKYLSAGGNSAGHTVVKGTVVGTVVQGYHYNSLTTWLRQQEANITGGHPPRNIQGLPLTREGPDSNSGLLNCSQRRYY